MKRLHVHVSVEDITKSVRFYSTLFAAEPAVTKPDYAKWMLDDPRVNFAISTRGGETGLDHLGIQVETPDELHEVYERLQQADRPVLVEGATTCCYARSEKSWITDPQGLSWELSSPPARARSTAIVSISGRSAPKPSEQTRRSGSQLKPYRHQRACLRPRPEPAVPRKPPGCMLRSQARTGR
jgi:catechol 2,3-dioxygenase-like lactoylglutathione lyase family enzyme